MITAWESTAWPVGRTPLDVFQIFIHEPHPFLLDSSLSDGGDGRYVFMGANPVEVFVGDTRDAWEAMKVRARAAFQNTPCPVPFASGLVGFISYDFGLTLEGMASRHPNTLTVPGFVFGRYASLVAIDLQELRLYTMASALDKNTAEAQSRALMTRVKNGMERPMEANRLPAGRLDQLAGDFGQHEYEDAVRCALRHIAAGDVYQINLSQKFTAPLEDISAQAALGVYAVLRSVSPSRFGAFLGLDNAFLLSSSPERFLRISGKSAQIKPMKGTRPRGASEEEDQRQYEELLYSAKEKAELLMITDLERNDLGRVCRYGSVHVSTLREIETYSTVFQATSTVDGELAGDKDVFDAIEASFPGGSITGCPKLRAMSLIDGIERSRRGFYTGVLGYIGSNGDADFNMLIRTLLFKEGKCVYHVGGGIVADSVPEQEYEETLVKARAMQESLERALR